MAYYLSLIVTRGTPKSLFSHAYMNTKFSQTNDWSFDKYSFLACLNNFCVDERSKCLNIDLFSQISGYVLTRLTLTSPILDSRVVCFKSGAMNPTKKKEVDITGQGSISNSIAEFKYLGVLFWNDGWMEQKTDRKTQR